MEPKGEQQRHSMQEAMENLKINGSTKTSNVNLPARKGASSSDAISCISSGDAASTVKESEMNQEASVGDQGMYYYGYYYPASFGGYDENGYFVGYNGLEVHPTVVQGDNGSYLCYLPGYENGYTYSPIVPGVIAGVDGQYISKEPYYSTISMQDPSTPGIFAQPVAYGPELVPAYTWDPSFALLDGVQGRPVGVHQTNYPARSKYSSNKHAIPSSKASRNTKSASDTIKGSSSALDMMSTSANGYPSSKTANKASGASISKGYPLSSKFAVHTNQGKGNLYQSKDIGMKESGRSWNSTEKLKARTRMIFTRVLSTMSGQVNASGQFCGVAEMVGLVDFNRNMNFWQQDKWNGFFPVKWHIIKDVPNPQFRHIILENNENKPVTNSRDTQEVKFPQGSEMLNIFKNFSCKTSILDDFDFYENRQKVMQDRRGKPLATSLDHPMLKVEKPEETKKPSQFVSTVDLDTTKTDEVVIDKIATELDTAKISEEQINKVEVEIDITNSSE
uniref:YTH domain-containing family protein n=1 Tax=Oryza punctata TaxID=4537 RepID=A0A0E0JMF4_ORYPU